MRELGYVPEGASGVFVSRWHHGSPAHRYGLYAQHWIVEVNGLPVSNIATFLAIICPLENGDFVRLKLFQSERAKVKVRNFFPSSDNCN